MDISKRDFVSGTWTVIRGFSEYGEELLKFINTGNY